MTKGSLIVIEGIDGSGKTTQIGLLSRYLKSENIPHEVINFPRYDDNLYGKLIKRYLEGKFGSISEVNPYLVALPFALDRNLAKPLIESWLQSGRLVIANRYASSAKAHLGANLPEEKREEFMSWLDDLEYETNRIPKADLTILLQVYPKISQVNIKGGPADIHEQSLKHLEQAAKIYLELSQAEANWKVVECMDGGKMKDKGKIHQEIVKSLSSILSAEAA